MEEWVSSDLGRLDITKVKMIFDWVDVHAEVKSAAHTSFQTETANEDYFQLLMLCRQFGFA